MLGSLSATRGLQLDIIGHVIDYWTQLDNDIAAILQDYPDNPSSRIDTTNFSPATEGQKNPSFPPWNVLAPTDRVSRVFGKELSLNAAVFEDKTDFEAFGSNT